MALSVTTTIRVERSLKQDLERFKNTKSESYSDVIKRLVASCNDDPISDDEIRQIEASLADIKAGRILKWKEAKKEWGV